jgi:cardiolipin synthase A/B
MHPRRHGPALTHALQIALGSPTAVALVEAAWIVGMGSWLLLERRSPAATLAWILALAFMPLVGIPVYLFVGPRRLERKRLRMALARRAHSWLLDAWERTTAAELTASGQLMRLATRLDASPPETARSVSLLADGDACYDALVEAIRASRHHVHAEYYIFAPDRAGARIRDALAERARAGVQVRLLVDAAGSSRLGRGFLGPLLAAGGKVARFNRVLFGRVRRPVPNFRTHRKILVCDGAVGFAGGMNVSDDHSRAARGDAAWRDVHVRIEGAAVHGLQLAFFEDWGFATGSEEATPSPERLRHFFPAAERGEHVVQIVTSGPDQPGRAIANIYFAAIAGARERVWVTTPYFVPPDPLLAALSSAALRGVDVRLVLPRATDSFVVDAAGSTFHDELAAAGVRIHLHGPPMIHAKTCVVDRDLAIVGSANLDNRSFRLNFEVVVAVYGGPTADELARIFEDECARSLEKKGRESERPLGRRLLSSAARLLASQL